MKFLCRYYKDRDWYSKTIKAGSWKEAIELGRSNGFIVDGELMLLIPCWWWIPEEFINFICFIANCLSNHKE